jgi:predicted ATPase
MDRITHVRIRNVRAIESVDLELGRPLTVLIGENGAGKSTIIECLELLRKAAEPRFVENLYAAHRGMVGLLRRGATEMSLGVRIESDSGAEPVEYELVLRARGQGIEIGRERLFVEGPAGGAAPVDTIQRTTTRAQVAEPSGKVTELAMDAFGTDNTVLFSSSGLVPQGEQIGRVRAVLRAIEVHLGFDTLASWAARSYQRPEGLRAGAQLRPADRLNLLAGNLASAWSELLAQPSRERERALDLLRLGLGDRVDTVVVKPDMGGGNVYLGLRFTDLAEPVFAADLSDGQLAWLAFVAMAGLNGGRSLLAVDEPELHMHPALLGRVVSMLANLPGGASVVLATHSDRVLEMLDDPADAVRVCTLRGSRAEMSRIDGAELPRWLDRFGDVGQLRAAGYLSRVLVPAPSAASDDEGGE